MNDEDTPAYLRLIGEALAPAGVLVEQAREQARVLRRACACERDRRLAVQRAQSDDVLVLFDGVGGLAAQVVELGEIEARLEVARLRRDQVAVLVLGDELLERGLPRPACRGR